MPDTKIIATMGPASADMAVLEKMAKNGLSAVRINTAHADPGYIGKIKGMIDRVNKKLGTYIGVLVDLKGPELRTGNFPIAVSSESMTQSVLSIIAFVTSETSA